MRGANSSKQSIGKPIYTALIVDEDFLEGRKTEQIKKMLQSSNSPG